MLFTKDAYNYNLKYFKVNNSEIMSTLRSDEFVAYQDINNKLYLDKKDFENTFYTDQSFKKKYGIEMEIFLALLTNFSFSLVLDVEEYRDELESFWDKQLEKVGKKLFNSTDNMPLGDDIIASPKIAYYNCKTDLMFKYGDKQATVNFIINLYKRRFAKEIDYFKQANNFILFDKFKKDIIEQIPSMHNKLDSVLGFIFVQNSICDGHVEKKAIDYYLDKSNFLYLLNQRISDKALAITEREVDNWIKKHNYPESFYDFSKNNNLFAQRKLITQLLSKFAYPIYRFRFDKDYDNLDKDTLVYIFSVINEYPQLYSNNKFIKDFLVYFCYAIYPIIMHGRDFVSRLDNVLLGYEESCYDNSNDSIKLEREIEPLKKQLKQKQDNLNKLQLDYDRLKNKEMAKLKSELEEQRRLLKEQIERNKYLEEMNTILENQLEEIDTATPISSSDSNRPTSYIENRLKSMNIVIMGGHQIWQNRLKEIYPYFNYIDSDNVNYDINITRNADIIFFNTLHCSHTLFYRIKNNVNNGRTNNKEKLVYIGSNNLGYFKDVVSKTVL